MPAKDNTFAIKFKDFNLGQAPLAHIDSLSEVGSSGHYSVAGNVDIISKPGRLTQGPGLATLTAGTQAGAIDELINYITDKAVAASIAYGIGATKLHQITPTAVINAGGVFPHTITNATSGSSLAHFQGALYYFYNKASGGDFGKYDLASTFDDDYGSSVPTGAAALQNAPHPVASKEDILMIGNGRYIATFISSGSIFNATKLDFGVNSEVADVAFHANQWYIAVNSGITSGTNRASSQIYLYDGAAISAQLADEVAVGVQQIGFVYPLNGVVYVAYKDLSSTGGFAIGYLAGRQIKPLRYFTGTLPTFAQKTLYKGTIAFVSNGLIYSLGAVIEQLPVQLSQLADGGFTTVGAIAAPFGNIMVASTQTTSFKLAQFSGFDTACSWKSIIIPLMKGRMRGMIDTIVVATKTLETGASCSLVFEANQGVNTSSAKTITGAGIRRFIFQRFNINSIEDFRLALDWSGGSATKDCEIRSIEVMGHFVEN